MRGFSPVVGMAMLVAVASPAAAQRVSFERTFTTTTAVIVDASTLDGRISLRSGPPGEVAIRGTATVRVAFNVPGNAAELARQIADAPPITRQGDVIRLRPPADPAQRRAATVAYDITLPPGTTVTAESDSGGIEAFSLPASAVLRTQSGRIAVSGASGDLTVSSGSGAVTIDGAGAALTVTTASSAIGIRGARGMTRIKTQSGGVNADVAGTADVDVQTGSSAITLSGVGRSVGVRSQSGAIRVSGRVGGNWNIESQSGRLELAVSRASDARVNLSNRSGSITVPDALSTGGVSAHHVEGTLGSGANRLAAASGSGSIVLRVDP